MLGVQWKVVGVTVEALSHMESNYNYYPKGRKGGHGIQRCHLIDRKKSLLEALETRISSYEGLRDFFEKRSATVLGTKAQNAKNYVITSWIPIDGTKHFLNLDVGFKWNKSEAELLSDIHNKV